MIISEIRYNQAFEKLRFDAEYYQPEFLKTEAILIKIGSAPLNDVAKFSKLRRDPKKDQEKDFEYIDISNINISSGDINIQTLKGHQAPSRARKVVRGNDVIISTVRPNRNAVAIIPEELNNQICSTGFAVIQAEEINPLFLFVYLKTKYAINQLVRMTVASMYPAVSEDDIGSILIPIPPPFIQQKIESFVKDSYQKRKKADINYKEAEELLIKTLGIKEFKEEEEKIYEVKFFEIEERLDAEYYKPKYMEIIRSLKSNGIYDVCNLNEITKEIRYGTSEDLDYTESGVPFLRLVELNEAFSFDLSEIKYIRESDAQRLKTFSVQEGDLLISRTGTVGCTVYIDQALSNSIFGSYFIRVRIRKDFNPLYVSFFLNSIYGKFQSERKKTGAVQTNLTIPAILSLKIALPPREKQDEICKKYLEGIALRKEGKKLLEKAKREVEKFIESNSG